MTTRADTSAALAAREDHEARAQAGASGARTTPPFKFTPRAALYRLGGVLAPGYTGRIATREFGRSRIGRQQGDFLMPLGARRFHVGDPDVENGYLWPGDGPTVLLVHGWSADSGSMLGFVRPLLELGFQVAAFDAPGHGASRGAGTTMSRFVEAGTRVAKALGNVEFLVGHSLGAIASTAIAARLREAGQQVRAMGLIAAPRSLSNVLEIWASDEGQQLTRAMRERVYSQLHRDNGVPVSHWDILGLSKGSTIPAVIVHDDTDPVVPFSCAEQLKAHLGSVVLHRTTGYGHSRILASAEAKAAVVDFISANRSATNQQ